MNYKSKLVWKQLKPWNKKYDMDMNLDLRKTVGDMNTEHWIEEWPSPPALLPMKNITCFKFESTQQTFGTITNDRMNKILWKLQLQRESLKSKKIKIRCKDCIFKEEHRCPLLEECK